MSFASVLSTQENMTPKTIIFGMGDQSRYCEEILKLRGYNNIVKTLWPTDIEINELDCGIVAIGDNWGRYKVVDSIVAQYPDFRFINAIHPTCIVSDKAKMSVGILAMAGCIFNVGAFCGGHTFFATGAQIEHDCEILPYASVSAGTVLGGHVKVGQFSALTLGCTIFDRVSIGYNTVVGSGSLVTHDLESNGLYYGSPTKFIRSRIEGEKFLK
jgi:acetyltransferase-like isoleucine patch superfamily enzyme